jgi:hypothetical protein
MFRRWMFYRFDPFSKPIRFYFQDAINVSEKTKSLNKGRGDAENPKKAGGAGSGGLHIDCDPRVWQAPTTARRFSARGLQHTTLARWV